VLVITLSESAGADRDCDFIVKDSAAIVAPANATVSARRIDLIRPLFAFDRVNSPISNRHRLFEIDARGFEMDVRSSALPVFELIGILTILPESVAR